MPKGNSGNIQSAFPLTPLQEGMLYHALKDPDSGFYHGQVAVWLEGDLVAEHLEHAFRLAAERHEALRTFFVWKGKSRPLQVVRKRASLPWTHLDWSGLDEADRERDWSALLEADGRQSFDLSAAPLARLTLARMTPTQHALLWSVHHAVFDGWSGSLVLREVLEDYESLVGQEPIERPTPPSFAHFVGWAESQDAAAVEAYWRRALSGFEQATPLPAPVGERARQAGVTRELRLEADDEAALRKASGRMRVTLATVVAAAWALLLWRYSGGEDVVFGATVSNRPASIPDVDRAAGLYLSTVPIRVSMVPEVRVEPWLRELQSQMSEARAHGTASLTDVARWSDVPAGNPILQSLVIFESFPEGVGPMVDRATLRPSRLLIDGPSDLPLALLVIPGDGLTLQLKYDPALYDDRAADRLLGQVAQVLEEITEDPNRALADVNPMSAEVRSLVIDEWSNDGAGAFESTDVVQAFEAQAARTPDAVALRTAEQELSYQRLDRSANQLAHRLVAKGLDPGGRVAVIADRSADTVIAFLGALKSGAAYIPVDPELPPRRLEQLLGAADLLVAGRHFESPLPDLPRVCVADAAADAETRPDIDPNPEAPAYIIYTSGSTGDPKGVVISRSNLAWSTGARLAFYNESPSAFLLVSPLTVDSSVAGLYWTLTTGGTLVLPPDRAEQDVAAFLSLMAETRISHTLLVPSLYQVLVEQPDIPSLTSLSTVIVAGEACTPAVARLHRRTLPDVRLYNEYGPSEATVWATVADLTDEDERPVTIGRPVPSARLYLLDEALRPVAPGIPGEICIAGPGVAQGYLEDAKLTGERFVPDPFRASGRLYRSGDRGRHLDDGRIQFLGRVDRQQKVRGYRVELAEIESALVALPTVTEAAVVWESGPAAAPSAGRLVAYFTVPGAAPTRREVDEALAHRLPKYMIPGEYVVVPELPRTPAGKVDRQALQLTEAERLPSSASVPPRTPEEEAIARVWREVLGIDDVGVHDDFFQVGGDSLSSIRVLSRASREGLEISPAAFFKSPTIAALAGSGSDPAAATEQGPIVGTAPLTPIQHWFFEHITEDEHHWNLSRVLEPPKDLTNDQLAAVIDALWRHHDALRTRIEFDSNGKPIHQEFTSPELAPWVKTVEVISDEADQLDAQIESVCGEVHSSIDLEQPELFRVLSFQWEGRPIRLALILHHLIVDAVSWGLLLEDLSTLAAQSQAGAPLELPNKTASVSAWAHRLVEKARELDEDAVAGPWLTAPAEKSVEHGISPESLTPPGLNRDGYRRVLSLDAAATNSLIDDAPGRLSATVEELLLAGLVLGWHASTGVQSVQLDLEGHGRTVLQNELPSHRTVGWFTTAFPIRLEAGTDPVSTLRSVQDSLAGVPEKGAQYGLIRYLHPDPDLRDRLAANEDSGLAFNYLGNVDGHLPADSGFTLLENRGGNPRSPTAPRAYRVEVNARLEAGRLVLDVEGTTGDAARVDEVAEHVARSLEELSVTEPPQFEMAGLDDAGLDALATLLDRIDQG